MSTGISLIGGFAGFIGVLIGTLLRQFQKYFAHTLFIEDLFLKKKKSNKKKGNKKNSK